MLIRNDTGFVAYAIIYILLCSRKQEWSSQGSTHLETTLTEELIRRAKRYLNNGGEFCHLFRGVVLDVGNALDNQGTG